MLTATFSPTQYGQLAWDWCTKKLPLRVLRSAAGFYIGTADDQCGPCSRESSEYFLTEAQAAAALSTGNWTQREHP